MVHLRHSRGPAPTRRSRDRGVLALVAVLVSLYPAVTVILALALLRERLRAPQVAGVAPELVAVVLISAS